MIHAATWQHGISLVLIGVTLIAIYLWRPARAISAVMLFCLVPCVAATGWKHHFLVLILPYAALAGAWDHLGVPARVLFFVSAVSSVIRAPELIGDAASLWLSEVSIALIAALTAWSALVLASRRLAMSDGELSPGSTPSRRRPRQ